MKGVHRVGLLLLLCVAAGCGSTTTTTAPIPTPIGVGAAFRPPAAGTEPPPERFACVQGALVGRLRAHVELFARKRVVVVPAGIGIRPPRKTSFGRVVSGSCRYDLRTTEPTGVVEFDHDGLTLADLFAVWGMPVSGQWLLSFRGRVSAYVGGKEWTGPVTAIPLRNGAEIVVEIGGYVPPHRSFLFPPR